MAKKRISKLRKRIITTTTLVIAGANVIAFNHAWTFTHYTDGGSKKIHFEKLPLTDKIIYGLKGVDNPRPRAKGTPALPYKTVTIQSNVTLKGWYIPCTNAKGTVIMFHGYKGEKSSLLERAYIIHQLGYNALLMDLMGAGSSGGDEVTIGYKEAVNIKDCYQYIADKGEQHIVLFGSSLGAAAIMKANKDYNLHPDCNIIEAPFSTLYQTVCNRFDMVGAPYFPMAHLLILWGGWQHGFMGFSHNPKDYAKHITVPTLLIYGAKDDRVTNKETQNIYQNLAGEKKLSVYPEAGHVNYLKDYKQEWTNDVAGFIQQYTK